MKTATGLFSIRIVVADFYMQRPISGLDPTYSDFRGHEIKTLPVIRIFGSKPDGEKTCMHIHGVFPYFYVPFVEDIAPDADQLTYQIAASLDKAINISLGQTNSQSQHVFKIQLVKGRPFYGYHPKEHQYLKIFLYNPRFVKKAANLLLNGAILGKSFQPHESHVPYILQFFIDYNLYGMSFLHVPMEIVKYRQSDEHEIPEVFENEQILSQKIARVSTSRHEVDIAAGFILNRFEHLNKDTGNTNPGIESIWQDERVRRKKLADEQEVPPLEIPSSQERLLAKPTESDIFYKAALRAKLAMENSGDKVLNASISSISVASERKQKFNLVKLLENSVYPSECSQDMNATLAKASKIPDHISTNSLFDSSMRERTRSHSSISMCDSFVDEEIVLSLSQPQKQMSLDQTLQGEDFELLEVMQQLEEGEGEIDLDSTLAPLSQVPKNVLQIPNEDKSDDVIANINKTESDDEENDMNYTISMDSVDKILMELSQPERNEKIPQFDGGDDLCSTPKRRKITRNITKAKRSPRSPKISSTSKYTPLDITINKSPIVKKEFVNGNDSRKMMTISPFSLSSAGQLINGRLPAIRVKRVLINLDKEFNSLNNNYEKHKANGSNFHPTDENSFIVCNLKPESTKKNTLIIEKCGENSEKPRIANALTPEKPDLKKCKVKIKRLHFNDEDASPVEFVNSPAEEVVITSSSDEVPSDNKNIVIENDVLNETIIINELKEDVDSCEKSSPRIVEEEVEQAEPERINLDANGFVKPDIRAMEVTNETVNRRRSWSPCDVSREYDRQNNYYPKAGPSGYKKGKKRERKRPIHTPSSKVQTRLKTKQQQQQEIADIVEENDADGLGEDLNICSFYEKSMLIDSPSVFSEYLSPQTPKLDELIESSIENSEIHTIVIKSSSPLIIITPQELPPTFEQVDEKSVEFNIADEVFPEPFYGDDADVTSKREIGQTVLHIPGRSLNFCADFESLIPNLKGLNAWRKKILDSMMVDSGANEIQNAGSIKEYFSCHDRVMISTRNLPPSKAEAKDWLENMAKSHKLSSKQNNNEDSPIKVRKEKVKMILDETKMNGDDDIFDLTQKSISLTPLTPDNVKRQMEEKPATDSNKNITPINRISTHQTPLSALQKFKERRKSRARLSLAKKLHRLGSLESASSETDSDILKTSTNINGGVQFIQQPIVVVDDDSNDSEKLSEHKFGSQQISDLCSEKVKQVLERTSFIRNLSTVNNQGGSDVSFGLSGVSLDNTFGFKISLQNLQDAKADIEHNNLTVFSLEIHVNTRGDLKPDPQYDAINCLFFNISNDGPEVADKINKTVGCIIVCEDTNPSLNGVPTRYIPVKSELELFDKLLQLCQEWNPDILVGYEIEMSSWGYLIERANILGMNLKAFLSRVPSQKMKDTHITDEEKETFTDLDIELKLCGRILLDVWRLMRSEIALTSYTFENVMFHILHRRVPLHSYGDLTKWYSSTRTRWIVLEYYLERVNGTIELLDQLDLIGRTSEMAKLIGIQFYEVLSRGSQFRVESMMLRIAKPKNFVPVSPSVQQRAHSRAPEYLPLILEPKSRFYADPMIVLDFQSLYPSMIIAYNYCFSTCLGRVEHLGQSAPFEFGCSQLRVSTSELNFLIENDLITISPCGVVFVKNEVREGVLPRMLKEILETRIMVKQSMKLHKTNSILQRVLHSRQLGLKLMANVTYGYTSANFSGRMACVEVADSVVGKGRETLERAIKLVESNNDWRAKVVYGDTDSLFILVPGRSRTEAFRIGEEIAEAVTKDNPQPVKLKLEKVYQPCILQTKKRYVGYMYESADQDEPIYEAKGIETVRRDGCPAVAKMLEKCIRILFESCDVSEVKRYVCRQFTKLLTGNANVQDLIFAKEFRGKNGYKPGACVPALELTRKWLQTDPRSEPRRGERVPFLIVNGPPGLPLIRLVRSPHEYLADEGLKINAVYYITKAIIPPLNRCLLLIGADVNDWFIELPRKHIALPTISAVTSAKRIFHDVKKSTISQYFASSNCIIDCGRHTKAGICTVCLKDSQKCTSVLSQKISKLERSYFLTTKLCQSCCGRLENFECCSLDCPVLFVGNLKSRNRKQVQHFEDILRDKFCVHNLF